MIDNTFLATSPSNTWKWTYSIELDGFQSDKICKQLKDIADKKFLKYNSLYKKNKKQIQNLRDEATNILSDLRKSKSFLRFWYNKKEKEMISKANNLLKQAYELEEKNKEICNKRFFDTSELALEITKILKQNGFVHINTTSSSNEIKETWKLKK